MATLRFDISEEQMAAFNQAATEAGYTVYEYAMLKLGFARDAQQARSKRELIAPNLETKDAPQVERQERGRPVRKATE